MILLAHLLWLNSIINQFEAMPNDFKIIAASIKSKADLYFVLTQQRKSSFESNLFLLLVNIFLPSKNRCSLRFMQGILNGKKEYFVSSEIQKVFIPNYPELSVAKLIEKASQHPQVMRYLPDREEKRKIEKEFVWHVLQKVAPDFVKQAITEAQKHRAQHLLQKDQKANVLVVKPELLERLKSLNLLRSKYQILDF